MTHKQARSIHLQPGPFAAQAVTAPVVYHTIKPVLSRHGRLLSLFAQHAHVAALVPLDGLLTSRDLPAFMPLLGYCSSLLLVKERRIGTVARVWQPPAEGLVVGTVGLFSGTMISSWYCDASGRGFDGSQLLFPIIMLATPRELD